jgi:hypothetical protein
MLSDISQAKQHNGDEPPVFNDESALYPYFMNNFCDRSIA